MSLRNLFSSRSASETIVIGAEGQQPQESVWPKSRSFLWISGFLLLGSLCLSVFFTGGALDDQTGQWHVYFQLQEEKKIEEQNLENVRLLMTQLEVIESDQVLFEKTLPFDQRYDHVVSLVEHYVEAIRKDSYVQLPELISWRPVSQSEVSNEDLKQLGIYEYQFAFEGEYEALMSLFQSLRFQLPLIDVRSVRNLKLNDDGMVSADVSLWTYNLYP